MIYPSLVFLRSPYMNLSYGDIAKLKNQRNQKIIDSMMGQFNWIFELLEKGECRLGPCLQALFKNTKKWPSHTDAWLSFVSQLDPNWTLAETVERIESWEKESLRYKTNHQGQGIQLMTVHAAKGLEFEHVYLVDGLRQPPTHSPLFYLSEKEAPGLRYREGTEWIPSVQYESLKEKEKALDAEEARRILYVAMTRAKESLTLFLPSGPKPSPKGSWAEMLA